MNPWNMPVPKPPLRRCHPGLLGVIAALVALTAAAGCATRVTRKAPASGAPVVTAPGKKTPPAPGPVFDEAAFAALLETLSGSRDEAEVVAAVEKIEKLGDPRALAPLEAATDRYPQGSPTRARMWSAFKEIASDLAFPDSLYALSVHNAKFRERTAQQLNRDMPSWRQRPETAARFAAAAAALRDPQAHVWVREGAAWFINEADLPGSLELLVGCLDPSGVWVNRTALEALRKRRDERAMKAFLRATGFRDGVQRLIAFQALQELDLPDQRYSELLDHEDPLVKGGAAFYLRRIGAAEK